MSENIFPPWVKARTHLTRQEAAKYLHVRVDTLAHRPRGIPYYKICGRILYIKEELDRLIHPHPGDENFANVSLSNRKMSIPTSPARKRRNTCVWGRTCWPITPKKFLSTSFAIVCST
ncbi:MAG: helix-turn-helix domain-containing protein [Puniceicoccales bacterium]|jgi:hypothetical protein|nr:helix-turn-helix domain-containing protein [Puniceicoccales bacterium]